MYRFRATEVRNGKFIRRRFSDNLRAAATASEHDTIIRRVDEGFARRGDN